MSTTILTTLPHHNIRRTIGTIVALIAIILVAMWTTVGVSLVISHQHTLDEARSQDRNLMIAFREEIAQMLRRVDGDMTLIAQRMRREGGNFDLYAWGQQHTLILVERAQATIVGPHGMLRQTTIDPHPRPIDLSGRPHFRIHLDGKFHGLYIGPPAITELSGQPFFPISRRVDAEDGTFLGVLVVPGAVKRI